MKEKSDLPLICLTTSKRMRVAIKRTVSIQGGIFKTDLLVATFLLDVLGEENTRMQARVPIFTELWDRVGLLITKLSKCLVSIRDDDYSSIGVSSLSPIEKEMFLMTIKVAMRNLKVRFLCPSTSLNKRLLGDTIKTVDTVVDRGVLVGVYSSCPLRLMYDVFVFPGEFLRNLTVKQYLLTAFDGEVNRLCAELFRMRSELRQLFKVDSFECDCDKNLPEAQITLENIFEKVDHSEYPLLWKCVFEVRCINPTTVSCEQFFVSQTLKSCQHKNRQSLQVG